MTPTAKLPSLVSASDTLSGHTWSHTAYTFSHEQSWESLTGAQGLLNVTYIQSKLLIKFYS